MKNFNRVLFALLLMIVSSANLISQVDRSQPPKLDKPEALSLPQIREFELSNGLKVILMEKHDVPLVQVNVVVKSGRVNDPENKAGLATIAADMLDEGAAGLDALQLADAIDYLGARIKAGAGYHSTEIALHTPLSKLDESLKLLSDIVLRPSFPERELERLRKTRLTTLMQWHDQPGSIASALFSLSLFGKNHPYGNTAIGDENSIRSLTIQDVRNYHSIYFKSNNAFLVVVGDVEPGLVRQKLEDAFGRWEKGDLPEIKIPDAEQIEKREVLIVDKPGSAQSVIQMGRIGVARNTEDYFSILVMNTLLGGSFASRLNQNLREEHGYTYGAGSYFAFRSIPGPMGAGASVQTEVTDSALIQFFKELNGIQEPVSDEELERAKNYAALSYPRNFQTVEDIASQLVEMVIYNLPKDYFNNYINNVLSVTGSDVMQAAKKYIVPGKYTVVVVGDKGKIEQGIRKLNLGEIKLLNIEDVLGKVPVTVEPN